LIFNAGRPDNGAIFHAIEEPSEMADDFNAAIEPADMADGWPVAAPEKMGLDGELIRGIGPHFDSWTDANAHAILIARHGTLVYERYFTGEDQIWGKPLGSVTYDAAKRHDLRSITKSVTSLLVGLGIDRGWLGDLDAPVFSFFPEHAGLRTLEKDAMTVRHLLTMSTGLQWNEELPYSNPQNSAAMSWSSRCCDRRDERTTTMAGRRRCSLLSCSGGRAVPSMWWRSRSCSTRLASARWNGSGMPTARRSPPQGCACARATC
jgi:hypothetical protein